MSKTLIAAAIVMCGWGADTVARAWLQSPSRAAGSNARLDVQNFCCPDYMALLERSIFANWDERQGVTGTTTIRFIVERSGQISRAEIERSSGNTVLDTTALRAVRAARLTPLPAQFDQRTLTVHLAFVYKPVRNVSGNEPAKGSTTTGGTGPGAAIGNASPSEGSGAAAASSGNTDTPSTRPAPGQLGDALRNLERYVANQTFTNPQGGANDPGSTIQFDSKGVEFGPWIRRFVAQVRRNWLIPKSAMDFRGHVVMQFNIHKNGQITDIKAVGPSAVDAFNRAASDALARSNPTQPLPAEYPDPKVFFTVTFYYNEQPPKQ